MDRNQLKLYLVTDRRLCSGRKLEDIVLEAVEGGVTMVQLREKEASTREFIDIALNLKSLLAPYGVPLIINDRVDVAIASGADGVHLGQSDMPCSTARALLGPDKIIGLSIEDLSQIEEANSLDIDYIGISPVFSTPTKTDTAPPLGLAGIAEASKRSRHPVVGIGGINASNAAEVWASGADGIAVVSAIISSPDPKKASIELKQMHLSRRGWSSGEFGLIECIKEQFRVPAGVVGIGDDCAVMQQKDGFETIVSTDMLIEGVHFLRGRIDPWSLGWKSAAVNLSDIAAMGGTVEATFLAIALPKGLEDGFMEDFIKGYKAISDRYRCPLLGGDTTGSDAGLSICVTVVGRCAAGHSLRRSTARPGDLICVTGPLGDSAAGLKAVLDSTAVDDTVSHLIGKHYRPEPRLKEGQILAHTSGIHAMMDISDGVGSDIRHILDASEVGAIIDTASIPLSSQLESFCTGKGLDPLDFALDGGEDYELLFTCSKDARPDIPYYVIGEITERQGIQWKGSKKDHKGFRHF